MVTKIISLLFNQSIFVMRLFTVFFAFSLLGFVVSCTEEKKEEKTEQTQQVNTDSLEVFSLSDDVEFFLNLYNKKFEFPLEINAGFINGFTETGEGEEISFESLSLLLAGFTDADFNNNAKWAINNFRKIDSLKKHNEYENYLKNIDIGMVKHSDAYFLGSVEYSDGKMLLISAVTCSSYEACPYFSGTLIFGSLVSQGSITSSILLGEDMSAGDPPVGMLRKLFSTINNNGTGKYELYEEHNDEDQDMNLIETTNRQEYNLETNPIGFTVEPV
jgi:hypothetical protein